MLTWRPEPPDRRADHSSAAGQEIDLARTPGFPVGPIMVQPSTLQIEAGGTSATIEPRIMQVLVALANGAGSVVSRDELIDRCWSGLAVTDDAINRCIVKLRRLGFSYQAFEIETIPRVGYRLTPLPAETSGAVSVLRLGKPILIVLAAALVLALAGAAWWWRSSGEVRQPTIAVLPFTALNADQDTKNLGESIASAIGNALVQTGAKLPDGDIQTVKDARATGASLIVSGTVRRQGSTYLVTARVSSAGAGSTILSSEFQANGSDAAALGGQAAIWLVPPVRMWASFLPVERDAAVTDEIMRIFLTRQSGDKLRAWELSRTLAKAHPGSGSAQLVFALLTSDVFAQIAPEQRRAAVASARQAAARAADLLPAASRAAAVRDCHLTAPGWQVLTARCDQATRKAIADDPDVPLLPFLFAAQLVDTGRFQEAARMADMDLAENPLGPGQLSLRILATRMMAAGGDDDLLQALEARIRRYLGPGATASFDFESAVANGHLGAAENLLRDPQTSSGIAAGGSLEIARLVVRAARTKARDDVSAMRNSCSPADGSIPPDPAFGTCLAGLALVADVDTVFALSARGFRDVECCSARQQEAQWLASGGDYRSRWPLFGKAMSAVRGDRRFIELARRTGLLAYWKSGHPPDFCATERAPVCDLLTRNR